MFGSFIMARATLQSLAHQPAHPLISNSQHHPSKPVILAAEAHHRRAFTPLPLTFDQAHSAL